MKKKYHKNYKLSMLIYKFAANKKYQEKQLQKSYYQWLFIIKKIQKKILTKKLSNELYQYKNMINEQEEIYDSELKMMNQHYEMKYNYVKLYYKEQLDVYHHLLFNHQEELSHLNDNISVRRRLISHAQSLYNTQEPYVGTVAKVDVDGYLKLIRVDSLGPGYIAGLRENDIIIDACFLAKYDDDSYEINDINEIFTNLNAGDILWLNIKRNDEIICLILEVQSKQLTFKLIKDLQRISNGIIKSDDSMKKFISYISSNSTK